MKAQLLDSMDLERERGITIKAQAVRVFYEAADGETYQLHLIDTPGHVDFTYEVSRSLAACEGALLLVDASQGVEAQTVANTYLAVDSGLELIPAMNKVDLPGAEPERVGEEIADLIGEDPNEVKRISAKTGEGVDQLLEEIVRRVPPPHGDPDAPARALIFDSEYDQYRGVIAYIRVVDGTFTKGETIRAMANQTEAEIDDIGFFTPAQLPAEKLSAGEVGYLITGLKDVTKLAVGDTLTTKRGRGDGAAARLPRRQADGVLRPVPDEQRRLPGAARRAREARAQRRRALLGARDLRRARLRLPLRLPRPAAHGHRARAPGARVRPRADGDDALRRVRGHAHRRRRDPGPQPDRHARPGPDRRDPRALHPRLDPHAEGVHRPDHGALPGPPRRAPGHALPLLRARAADLRPAAGRDRARLLRPAQDPHARLREPRLRADRPAPVEPRQARRAARRRPGRRAEHGRAPRQGLRPGQGADRAPAQEDPAPAVRRADPGRRRARRSSPARPSRPSARTSRPSATAATSPASASCSSARRRASGG